MMDIVSAVARLHRQDTYRLVRPPVALQDEDAVQLWLLARAAGWDHATEQQRRDDARHLIFAAYRYERGALSDDNLAETRRRCWPEREMGAGY